MSLIIKAAQLAEKLHRGVPRKYTGRPYIEHPCRVASRLATMKIADEDSVAAAYLHDVIEDCGINAEDLTLHLMGLCVKDGSVNLKYCVEYNTPSIRRIVDLVQWLTNPSKGSSASRAERKQMDREHLRNAPQIVKIIKMIDRIDNLREMTGADNGFKVKYAAESMLLANVIGDADNELYHELCDEIENLNKV